VAVQREAWDRPDSVNQSRAVFPHTRILQRSCPLAMYDSMKMFEVLAKVISAIEPLGHFALPKLVDILQMLNPFIPVPFRYAAWDNIAAEGQVVFTVP